MARPNVVFDCVVFAQAIISDRGPAAACLELARVGHIQLIWSDYVLAEIRELPEKLPEYLQITDTKVEAFIQYVGAFAQIVSDVPMVYIHPIDPDDSHYIDLAVASAATLITSRDRHLLNLMDELKPDGLNFRRRFPSLEIVSPEAMLSRFRRQRP
jgi:putative PIN family toxin of toxin-antitoxin system